MLARTVTHLPVRFRFSALRASSLKTWLEMPAAV